MGITIYSKEMYEAMDYFERNVNKVVFLSSDFKKEDKALWTKGHYYCNGKVNDAFLIFLFGSSYGNSLNKQ